MDLHVPVWRTGMLLPAFTRRRIRVPWPWVWHIHSRSPEVLGFYRVVSQRLHLLSCRIV
jgi:hypothetical protein